MLAHLRTAAPCRTPASWTVLSRSRGLASLSRASEEEDDDESTFMNARKKGDATDPSFPKWLASTGKFYRDPVRPRNWLGGKVPFPLNPSFKPPTPVSDRLRTQIYDEYMLNPEVYNVRALSERHGISIQRVDAILRLKGLEESWKKENKPLQTGFQVGMEEILGVTDNIKTVRGAAQGSQELGSDATQADAANPVGKARARDRYQRLFWEPVVEGQEPVVLRELERARMQARSRARAVADAKDAQVQVPHPKEEVHAVVERPGRPAIKFIDVGGAYVDVDERLERLKAAKHRSELKAKRRARAHGTQDDAKPTPEAVVAAH
ncbi:eukaryotic mitochondrial regulator protein-domain-containing protein [Rhodofomes roseus]|uniref:Eukaryotic mitochondrial regulator protein-domain-containing protein n=1 Tax=Rhodofomes roseus TaxID=34475 RepID=A0ABQ8KIZ3_9APHY|nr:eukaryotic mitochondrial regulator protein-domain-containing protein [Rhodofomes roseus]KAH9837357.1 eukaryotic mitochondrial regulator protein-domain-containing protein [Rhodofomes roseus]